MTERRFSEDEVGRIFELATKAQNSGRRHVGAGEGMTLAGLQEIAQEIGVPTELVTQAARSLDADGRETSRSLIGLTVGVANSVELGRHLSDAEWERFVSDLRDTFDATGRVESDGTVRRWRNSRLQVLVEPTETGHRVRFKTYNGTAAGLMGVGAAMFAFTGVMAASLFLAGRIAEQRPMTGVLMIGMISILSIGWGALRLPGWAKTRREQFKELAARLTSGNG